MYIYLRFKIVFALINQSKEVQKLTYQYEISHIIIFTLRNYQQTEV